MLQFEKMTDKEIEEYSKSHIDQNIEDMKEQYKECISSTSNKLLRVIGEIRKTVKQVDEDIDASYKKCHLLSKRISNISTELNKLPFTYGEKDSIKKIKSNYIDAKKVIFKKAKDELTIILPELLPHKQQFDTSSGKMIYYYDIDKWRASYYEVFAEEFINGKYKIYGTQVVICFINHYKNIKTAPDPDNIDTKVISDIISLFLLVDDSFPYRSQFIMAVEDDKDYTEIVICPQKDIIKGFTR